MLVQISTRKYGNILSDVWKKAKNSRSHIVQMIECLTFAILMNTKSQKITLAQVHTSICFKKSSFPFYNGNGHNLIMCTFVSSNCFTDLLIKQISSHLLGTGCNEANHQILQRMVKIIHLCNYVQPDQSLILSKAGRHELDLTQKPCTNRQLCVRNLCSIVTSISQQSTIQAS